MPGRRLITRSPNDLALNPIAFALPHPDRPYIGLLQPVATRHPRSLKLFAVVGEQLWWVDRSGVKVGNGNWAAQAGSCSVLSADLVIRFGIEMGERAFP